MEYIVNGKQLRYHVSNEKFRGDDVVLLDSATDLTRELPWHGRGFNVEKLFSTDAKFTEFVQASDRLLRHSWADAGLVIPPALRLTQYHQVADTQQRHLGAIEKTKLLSLLDFPVPIAAIEERVSELLKCKVKGHNPFDGQEIFHFRVVRPSSGDNNPLHRDVWLEDYADCINLYIPVAGSTEQSSLIIVSGSHQWPESRLERSSGGAVINGVKYNVPAVASISGDYEVIRPNPGNNEFLLFSPYLIHGGAINFNPDETRISIELRLWKA